MQQIVVVAAMAVAGSAAFGFYGWPSDEKAALEGPSGAEFQSVGYAEPLIGDAAQLTISNPGLALSSAAFGLEALQPETYDGEIVLDIIQASPLA